MNAQERNLKDAIELYAKSLPIGGLMATASVRTDLLELLTKYRAASLPQAMGTTDPIANKLPLQDEIEAVLFSRALRHELEGFTAITAHEIAEVVAARVPQATTEPPPVPTVFRY